MEIDLTQLEAVTNPKFWPLYEDMYRYLVLWGGGGSGKSWFAAEKILVRILVAMSRGYRHKFLCLRKTQPAARRSIFALFKQYIDDWGLRKLCEINQAQMTITFKGGSQIIIGGMDDPEKIKSIEGVTGVWVEEATEFTQAEFTQVDLRLRGQTVAYKQIILSFNPIDEQSWVKKRFFDYAEPKAVLHHSTYLDNRFIDAEYAEMLEALIKIDRNYYEVYCLGKWGVLKGLIYENWEQITEWPRRKDFDCYGDGLDFGFTNSPSALVDVGFIGDNLYVRERIYEKGLTNPDICNRLDSLDVSSNDVICADSAEPKSIMEISQGGYKIIGSIKGPDSVKYGIQRVKQYQIKVFHESVNVIKELKVYKWAEDKDGNTLDKPVEFMNHAMDAMRYIVAHLKGLSRGKITIMGDEGKGEARKERMRESYHVTETDDELIAVMEGLDE